MAKGSIIPFIQRGSDGSHHAAHSSSGHSAFFLIRTKIAPGPSLLLLTHQRSQTAGGRGGGQAADGFCG